MEKQKISPFQVMDQMTNDNNKAIMMSDNLQDVRFCSQGAILSFGVELSIGSDAKLQLMTGATGENMLFCMVVNRTEMKKTQEKLLLIHEQNTPTQMEERFDQLSCAQIKNLYWLMCQYENNDLKELLCEMEKEDFESCFPGVLSNPYLANIQEDEDEILSILFNLNFRGFLAQVVYPKQEKFIFKNDDDKVKGHYHSSRINNIYSRYGYIYAESKEELLTKMEAQAEQMVKYWIEQDNKR